MTRLIETAAENIAGWSIEIYESEDRCAVTLRDGDQEHREVVAVFGEGEVEAARMAACIVARTLAVSIETGRFGHC